MEQWEIQKEIDKTHAKHAWTLAFIVWVIGAAAIYAIDMWLASFRPGGFAELARYAVYAVAFFYIAALGWLKDYFYCNLVYKNQTGHGNK